MFKNYLTVGLRSLARNRLYTIINVFGLAFGMAFCVLVLGLWSHDLTFDDFHPDRDRIYRVQTYFTEKTYRQGYCALMSPLGPAVAEQIPDVESVAMFRRYPDVLLEINGNRQRAGDLFLANPDYLKVFAFEILRGPHQSALTDPFTVLITEQAAHKYFPDQDPIGKTVSFNGLFEATVIGVLKTPPTNTQLQCEFLGAYATVERIDSTFGQWNLLGTDYVYLKLREGVTAATVEQKLTQVLALNLDPETASAHEINLKALGDIYYGAYDDWFVGELEPRGEASLIYEIGSMTLLVLIIAIVNFVNLATARAADRTREIGVRKVLGANRWHFVRQFLGESTLLSGLSMIVSLAIYEFLRPVINDAFGRVALADLYTNPYMILFVIALTLLVGVLAGLYPGFYMSKFSPQQVLHGSGGGGRSRNFTRKGLVLLQFAIAIFFICVAILFHRQISHWRSVDIGFDADSIMTLDFDGDSAHDDCLLMKNILANNQYVEAISACEYPVGRGRLSYYGYYLSPEDLENEDHRTFKVYHVDSDYLATYGLTLTRGRSFEPSNSADLDNALVLTESSSKLWEDGNPVGKPLFRRDGSSQVVGVVDDFHGMALSRGRSLSAYAFRYSPDRFKCLAVRLRPDSEGEAIESFRNEWRRVLPGRQFIYSFADEELEAGYGDFAGMTKQFSVIAGVAVTIACLGIFALVSYTAQQRSKEIGIRKVLGASVLDMVIMLAREFGWLLLIANALAWPVAYLMISDILSFYAHPIEIGPLAFLFSGLLTAGLTLAAAGIKAYQAALANPTDSLRYE